MNELDFLPDDEIDCKPEKPLQVNNGDILTQCLPAPPLPKIDIKKAIEMRLKGVSCADIGKLFGCSRQAVHQALKPYVDTDGLDLEVWKEKRADILASKQATALQALDAEDIKKASPKDKALIFGILYDKERLERGQSTSNVSVLFQVSEEAENLQRAEFVDCDPVA
jgi:hypothetical protein